MQGFNPHNVGMFSNRLGGIEELIEYIKTQSVYCTMREGRYLDFEPITVREYFSRERVSGEYFDGEVYKNMKFTPREEDLQFLRTFKLEDLTFRGTVEYRSSCCQPISDVMTVASFHTGLANKLSELRELIRSDKTIYNHGYTAAELQDMLSKYEIPGFINKKNLSAQLIRILDIARDGLRSRGKNEEHFLDPLYLRAEASTNPAKVMVEGLSSGRSMEDYIESYAQL